jgi:hypothetical protein
MAINGSPTKDEDPQATAIPSSNSVGKDKDFFPLPVPLPPARPLPALSPLEYFQDAELLCAFPIEDNTLLRQAFDLDRLAIANALFAENPQRMLVLEAMLNLKGQKGGAFLKSKTHPAGMMVESLQLQTPLHQKLFQNPKEQPLLNRNITYLKVQHFRKTIPQEGLYFTFSAKDPDLRGLPGIWPDLVTCILTQSPQFLGSGVFYEEGLAIENFKTATDIPLLVQRFKEQEEQEGFHALWHQYRHALEI